MTAREQASLFPPVGFWCRWAGELKRIMRGTVGAVAMTSVEEIDVKGAARAWKVSRSAAGLRVDVREGPCAISCTEPAAR